VIEKKSPPVMSLVGGGFLCKSHPKVHQIDHEYIIRHWLKRQHLYNKGLSLAQRRCRKQWIC